MHTILRIFAILLMVIAAPAQALVLEVNSIIEALPYVRSDSLVVLGVHGILLETAQMLGSEEWAEYEVQRRIEKEKMTRAAALQDITPIWHRILLVSPVKTVELTTMGAIRQMQKKGGRILGIARQEVEMAYPILSQLKGLDIDLVRSAPSKKMHIVSIQPYMKYIDGVLFVGTGGDVIAGLTQFIDQLERKPKHLVYIDTDLKRIEGAVEGFGVKNIEIQGLRIYPRNVKSSIYLPAVADIQMKYLDRMLPDKEAMWLVEHGLGVEP